MPTSVIVIHDIIIHEPIVIVPPMVFSYDSRIRIVIPNIKMHESIVFNLVICEHTTIIHYANFVKDSNAPNGGNGPLNLLGPSSISKQPYEGIGFI